MVVQHNIMAINSHRQLGINNSTLSKNLEKLSSGYRINKAADDAAGLAISEKMRAQITGLDRATLNAQDGASLIQTAEGALTEVHSMLNRMVELATQSANGTIQAEDRQKVEAEVTALKDEIDRISKSTNFNGIKLLDGSLSDGAARDITVKGVKVAETAAQIGQYEYTGFSATTTVQAGDVVKYTISLNNGDSFNATFEVQADGKSMKSLEDGTMFQLATTDEISASEITDALETQLRKEKLNDDFIIDKTTTGLTMKNRVTGTAAPQITGVSASVNDKSSFNVEQTVHTTGVGGTVPLDEVRTIKGDSFMVFQYKDNLSNEENATFSVDGVNFILVSAQADEDAYKALVAKLENTDVNIIKVGHAAGALEKEDLVHIAAEINQKTGLALRFNDAAAVADQGIILDAPKTGNGLTMQVGDTAEDFNKITVSVDDMSSNGLGIKNISMASQEAASRALDRINAAIEKVSVNRGNLGALQNRLEHTINNLGVTSENMTAAESRVRDVDMAKEMMQFTKNNVLSQAAQAMLAQANQQPQQVLQLLR